MDALVETECREEGGDAVAKNESPSKPVLLKGLPPKSVGSSRLLPKGTKSKVNLEEQGRQKVSFSFSQTKKPLQNLFLAPLSPEKPPCDLQFSAPHPPTSPPQDRAGLPASSRNEPTEPQPPTPATEPLAPPSAVPSAPKAKLDPGKMHFKKQILSVSASLEQVTDIANAPPGEPSYLEQDTVVKSVDRPEPENPVPPTHHVIATDPTLEEPVTGGVLEGRPDLCLKGPIENSHIGKEDRDRPCAAESAETLENRKNQSQSDSTLPGSESDGDSVRTSSSHKSGDLKSTAKVDGRSKDVKRNSSGSRGEESEKSSQVRSEKDERFSSHMKSERESRRTSSRSSRSDKDRRKSKSRSRSRSRSRGSRTSSSYSRSERSSRNDRLSRADRSHYRDSDRRSHRSSPHRERRSSRSRAERRSRDSSDSEDDHRRSRTRASDSNRSSTHSSSYRESKSSSSYSKSDKDSKSTESSRSSESEKRTQLYSRSKRYSTKTLEPEPIRRSSPEVESSHRKESSSVSVEPQATSSKKVEKPDSQQVSPSKPSLNLMGVDRQSQDKLSSPEKLQTQSDSDRLSPFRDSGEKVASQLADSSLSEDMDNIKTNQAAVVSNTERTQHLTVPESCSTDDSVPQGCDQTDPSNEFACSRAKQASNYSLRSKSKSQSLEYSPPQKLIPSVGPTPECQPSQSQGSNLPDKCTSLPDTSSSSETFRERQKKGEDCTVSKTLVEDVGKRLVVAHSEADIPSHTLALNHQICSKDYSSSGPLENTVTFIGLSEGSCGTDVLQVLYNEAKAVSCHMTDSLEVTNGLSASKQEISGAVDIVSENPVPEVTQGGLCVQPQIHIAKDSSEEQTNTANTTAKFSSIDGLEQNPLQIKQNAIMSKLNAAGSEEKFPDGNENTKPMELIQASQYKSSVKVTECMGEGLQPEQLNNADQQSSGFLKTKKSNVKKSRWDIVGQDNPDCENSLKMPCHESKPAVKKVISVKSIEFSKEPSLEDACLKKESSLKQENPVPAQHNLTRETQMFSKRLVVSVKKENVGIQGDSSLRSQVETKLPETSESAPQSQLCDTSTGAEDVKPHTDVDFKYPTKSNHSSSGLQDDTRKQERMGEASGDQRQDSTWRKKLGSSSNVSLEQDVGGHSEESDTEESESDSDDSSIPKKRLHSVVVVPKNSTLTLETRAILASSSSHSDIPGQVPGEWKERSWMEPSSQQADRSESVSREVPERGFPIPLSESSQHSLQAGANVKSPFATPQSTAYQSQSNTVDSTSQLEAARGPGPQHHVEQNPKFHVKPKTPVALSHAGTFHNPEDSWSDARHCEGPDSWHGRKRMPCYQQADFSGSDDFDSHGWDFTQPEQPSSTYQQPDSSFGVQKPSQSANPTRMCGQGNSYWTPPPASEGCRPAYLPVPSHYREPVGQVQPDSLTNDCDEDSRGRAGPHGRAAMVTDFPPTSSFVQAHEISSNCRGLASAASESAAILDTPRGEDRERPHRGRGPPKKRRPELESDSENEAEAGLSSKRERLSEEDGLRTSKDPGETPTQTSAAERPLLSLQDFQDPVTWKELAKAKKMPPYFDLIEENLYLTERKKNKSHRDIKRMQCECSVLSREERARGATACGEDCLNRLLMIECSSRCLNGAYCSNRRFQMKQHADFEVILTENKGWGLRAAKDLTPNTFVLEYCGEVLDHKEFKARVKEYARSKNIHYYFMALKNNEIIDATLKGNCSRFMNHSCEPNCETQKWTVNGQLRVGFFTTKAVTAGTELTFDYQFQRYGKEAQKCLCGAPTCRGFLGGENRVSIRAAGGRMKKERSRKKDSVSALTTVDEELEALLENGEGLSDEKQVVSLCRLMVRVETIEQKLTCLKLIQNTQNPACLKQFLDHHGLSLLWIFMVELSEAKGNNIKLQLEIMKSLAVLPISTKNMLEESRVLQFIQRWAQNQALPPPAEQDGYSSENTSRAQTPLNTPDGPPVKPGQELDGDTPKRAVYRRLKIISENSLDSALSDASKASDGKEDEEEEEEEEEEEDDSSQAEPAESSQAEPEPAVEEPAEAVEKQEPAEPMEGVREAETETKEAAEVEQEQEGERTEGQEAQVPLSQAEEEQETEKDEAETKRDGEEETGAALAVAAGSEPHSPVSQTEQPSQTAPGEEPPREEETKAEEAVGVEEAVEGSAGVERGAEGTAGAEENAAVEETPCVQEPPASVEMGVCESGGEAAAAGNSVAAAEPVAVGTPSQDEEEGVSDVESERSQEPPLRAADIADMAARLLDSWKDLKEVYRIPKKSQVEKEPNERSRDRDAPMTPRTPSGSREREREKDRDRDRDRDRDCERDRDRGDRDRTRERDRDRDAERTPRSTERRRRRASLSPPPSAYDRSSRRGDDRYDHPNSSKKKGRTKERNKLTTEERRKLFEQEVAQREAQKQQQQLQTMAYDALSYSSSPHGFLGYPPGYPIQTYVDPSNPNAGKVLLPTPSVEPLCAAGGAAGAALPYEPTPAPAQPLIPDLGLASPSPTSQAPPVSGMQHVAAPLEMAPQYVQPGVAAAAQDPAVAVLPVPAQAAGVQVQGQQGYASLWDAGMQQALTVQAPPAQQYPAAPAAQPQTAIYYPGQPCQTVYSIPAAYPQTNTPVIQQTYTEPSAGYLQGQQVYTGHQQGVVLQQAGTVTTIVTAQTVQQEMMVPNSLMDLPPPSPPKPKTIVLPPSWKVARDPEGKIYYYHVITRQTQWDPPCWEGSGVEPDNASVDHEAEMDLGTPTYDENPSKFSTKTAEADTSSELAKKSKEVFRKEMSQFIVQCLNPYRKPDCKLGRISNTEDFKHLARKLTHGVMNKELKSCKNPEDLECNENVKHKTKEYIKKYMQKFGPIYRPKEDTEVD
ncbi:hypothetical protein MATL_G00132080 [Megalops atlanticus]|uniref:[histone H3]-lysine(36) N-trimethyltransferase n=1 Tax=Megalops atlanticus TaxID=7932 RepID=A0A9D3Q0Z9_MEGAT|nr:hypothetical protein MATL_G00132080 [Megalops atlanticus]